MPWSPDPHSGSPVETFGTREECTWGMHPKTSLAREQQGNATSGWDSGGQKRAILVSPPLRKGPGAWRVELDVVRWEGTSTPVGGPSEGPEVSGPGGSGTG